MWSAPWNHRETELDAHVAFAGRVFDLFAHRCLAKILVGWDINHARLRTERDRRPVLAAPQRWAEGDLFPRTGLMVGINFRAAAFRINSLEHVLTHVWLAIDEVQTGGAALQEPQVAVAGDVHQTFDAAVPTLEVEQDGRRDLIPIPGIIGVVLEVTFDLPSSDVDGDGGCRIQVVAWTLIAHPGSAISDAPVSEVGVGIVIAGDPHRASAGFPLVALGPGFAAGLAGRGYGVSAPELFAGVGIEGRDEAANAILAARSAHHDFSAGH